MPQAASSAQHLSRMHTSHGSPPSRPSTNQRSSQFAVPVVPVELLAELVGDVLHAKKAKTLQSGRRRPTA